MGTLAVVPTVSRHNEGVAAGDLLWGRRLREWYQSIVREPARHAHLQRCLLGRTHLVTHDTFLDGRLHNPEWLLSRILRVTARLQCGASAVQTLVEQGKAEITSGIGTKRRCFSRSPSTTVTMWRTGAGDGLSLVLRQLRAAFITLRVGLHRADSQWRHLPELDDQARGKRAQEIEAEREGSDQRGRRQLQANVGLPRDEGVFDFKMAKVYDPALHSHELA